MAWSDVRDRIEVDLNTVSNAGIIYDHFRYSEDIEIQKNLISSHKLGVRVWFIGRQGGSHDFRAFGGKYERNHRVRIDFFMGRSDDVNSDNTFHGLVDSALTALETDKSLASVGNAEAQEPLTFTIGASTFAEVGCHHCVIEFVAREVYNVTWT